MTTPTPQPPLDLAELKKLESEATPGPWSYDGDFIVDVRGDFCIGGNNNDYICADTDDINLIVALRNAAAALIARVEELERMH